LEHFVGELARVFAIPEFILLPTLQLHLIGCGVIVAYKKFKEIKEGLVKDLNNIVANQSHD
jgi:hypothetical protein